MNTTKTRGEWIQELLIDIFNFFDGWINTTSNHFITVDLEGTGKYFENLYAHHLKGMFAYVPLNGAGQRKFPEIPVINMNGREELKDLCMTEFGILIPVAVLNIAEISAQPYTPPDVFYNHVDEGGEEEET
jgi:hypothetical protein